MADSDESLDRAIEALKRPAPISRDFTRRVMGAIAELPRLDAAPEEPASRRWSARRWTIRVSPMGGLGLAAGLAGLMFLASRVGAPNVAPVAAPAGGQADGARPVQFVLVAPAAATVSVVGDFNDWDTSATPLARTEGDGLWWVTVPLSPGRYRYSFVVDGTTWRSDPDAPAVDDEFGRPNSVVTIGGL